MYATRQLTKIDVSFTSNHLQDFLRNIPFYLARCICTIVENENTKLKQLSAKTLKQQKYCIAVIENSIKRDLQIPSNKLSKPTVRLYSQS